MLERLLKEPVREETALGLILRSIHDPIPKVTIKVSIYNYDTDCDTTMT